MHDILWQALITGAVAVIIASLQVLNTWLQLQTRKAVEKAADDAAAKADEDRKAADLEAAKRARDARVAQQSVAQAHLAARAAVEEAKDVKAMVAEDLSITHKVHELVNGVTPALLQSNAELARWKADQTGDEEHRKAAERAEKMYRDHMAKQAEDRA